MSMKSCRSERVRVGKTGLKVTSGLKAGGICIQCNHSRRALVVG